MPRNERNNRQNVQRNERDNGQNMPWREAVIKVLSEAENPMHYRDITEQIIKRGLRTRFGEYPQTAVNFTLRNSINNEREYSPFILDSIGTYALKDLNVRQPDILEQAEPEDQQISEIRRDIQQNMPWKDAIIEVLTTAATSMHYVDITEQIVQEGLRTRLGATPQSNVNVTISNSINSEKDNSPFIRVGLGTYGLRGLIVDPQEQEELGVPVEIDTTELTVTEEEQYNIITSFGMFWRRKEVRWTRNPILLGGQFKASEKVDFCNQIGIYILYDVRGPVYVGRTTEGSLGQRLYEHNNDRLATRWDRFSWFGLLPVSEDGELGILPEQCDASKIAMVLEAVLIEGLEPVQNRRRGDGLEAVEYIQIIDPEIEREQMLAAITGALGGR